MKFLTAFVLVGMVNSAFALSAFEKKQKDDMLNRTETLIEKAQLARDLLKKEDVSGACVEIQEIFKLYPDHLKSIGSQMSAHKTKVLKIRDEAFEHLIFFHKHTQVCAEGENSEHVDGKYLSGDLKDIIKKLKKHKKLIKKEDTSYSNRFQYSYEF